MAATLLQRQKELAGQIGKIPATVQEQVAAGAYVPTNKLINSAVALVEKHWDTFCSNHNALTAEKGVEATEYFVGDHYSDAASLYLTGIGILESLRPKEVVPPVPVVVQAPREALPPLPKVDLPEFSGSYLDWEPFRDAFEGLVLNRSDVPDVQKLLLLKRALKGDAALLVRNIAATTANFKGAWDAVCARYKNERLLVHAHLSALFDLPQIPKESAREMRALIDRAREEIRSLCQLGRPVAQWDDVLVFTLLRRLDSVTRREWEMHLTSQDAAQAIADPKYSPMQPTFQQFESFLEARIRALEMSAAAATTTVATAKELRDWKSKSPRSHQASVSQKKTGCVFCGNQHGNFSCPSFRERTPQDRLAEVRKLKICFNCLGSHQRNACKSSKTCAKCKQAHNTLLHDVWPPGSTLKPFSDPGTTQVGTPERGDHTVSGNSARVGPPRASALLTTALVTILSPGGQRVPTRALLDTGSEVSFVSEDIVQSLKLSKWRSPVKVVGVGASYSASASSQANVVFESRLSPGIHHRISAFVLPRLTAQAHARAVCPLDLRLLPHIQLADPNYYRDQKVGLILGADIFGSLLRPGVCTVPDSSVVAINTALGWVLSGTVAGRASTSVSTLHCRLEDDMDRSIRRFWEIEEISSNPPDLTPEERACEELFASTHQRDDSGRFVVRLPRKSDVASGDNRKQAVRSLFSLERRLSKAQTISEKYHQFMQEYESLGHMQRTDQSPNGPVWYLPHHAVVQSGPRGEKLRVVFDASRSNDQGMSLNQFLHPGPALQNDLGTVIMNWRNHRIVFGADIVKMFRQILVHPDDQDLQRIVWRADPNDAVQDFKLATVTYGTTCAPYLAIRVLHELAHQEKGQYPMGSECLVRDSYVDDILSGADSLQDARHRCDELVQTLARGHFQLSKWSANRPELLDMDQTVPGKQTPAANVELAEATKLLGILWIPGRDEFCFQENLSTTPASPVTKRVVLSKVSQLFDPLGWIAPVIIVAKVLLQDLWLAKCGWDEPIGAALEERWYAFQRGLSSLADIRLPRWTRLTLDETDAEIHGFADASTRAYAAVVYLRTVNPDGTFYTTILVSKTKVAPVKTVSVPRLELCAAQLLVRLLLYVRQSYRLSSLPMYGWSDSTVTLSWIQSHPSRWKTFVANRTSFIQSSLPELTWRHVSSSDNPADIASRGSSPYTLTSTRLWWEGPTWLSEPMRVWPTPILELPESPGEESPQKSFSMSAQVEEDEFKPLQDYSSLTRLIRVTAQCMRFARHCDKGKRISSLTGLENWDEDRKSKFLTSHELAAAKIRLIRRVQKVPFVNEIEQLKNTRPVSRTSPLATLHPFLDEHGVIRVGGRLENSNLPQLQKHPPILPKSSELSLLFIRFAHSSALHAGLSLTFSLLQEHVWVLRGRVLTKKLLRACVICRRHRPQMGRQLMGQLPAARVTPCRPFLRSGVDYAGPLKCRPSGGRGRQSIKAYIALFVCLSTKALHLEVVSDLTTAAFLAAFRRFVARRGLCSELLSDNGTTFVGADAELRSMFQKASVFYSQVASTLAGSGTNWSFIPPASPHFGGLWEAGVKSVKGLLRKTVGDATLTYEELSTVLAQVEACLNSRPLTPLSSDETDLSVLTPAHFLVGSPILTVPEPSPLNEPSHLVTRWRLVQQLTNHFWRKWSAAYLHQLQQRSRWRGEKENFTVGQLVLVHHPQLPAGRWSLGRVTKLHPGADGLVRVVTVKTASAELRRPISRLSILPVQVPDAAAAEEDPPRK